MNCIKNAKKLGEGVNGVIYKKNDIVIKNKKNKNDLELRIQAALYQVVPGMIIKPLGVNRCDDKLLYYMEFIDGDTMFKTPSSWTRENFNKIIRAIYKIKSVYPSFRHNDLHLNNIIVDKKGNIFIADFGFANIRRPGFQNPKVVSGNYIASDGIHEYNDPSYDIHLFINSLYLLGVPELQRDIEKIFPKSYLGMNETSKIRNMRLKFGIDLSNFPSDEKILNLFN